MSCSTRGAPGMPASCSNGLDRRTWSDREQKRFLYTLVVSNFIFYLEIVKREKKLKKYIYIMKRVEMHEWSLKWQNNINKRWCYKIVKYGADVSEKTESVDGAKIVLKTFDIFFSNNTVAWFYFFSSIH